jgi:hypothetical protein
LLVFKLDWFLFILVGGSFIGGGGSSAMLIISEQRSLFLELLRVLFKAFNDP